MKLTAERLREVLRYSPETGLFYWIKSGKRAGCRASNGYIYIRIDTVLYLAHRLAVLFVRGEWPEHHVDHENRATDDNRWLNLRDCDRSENMCNAKKRCNSKSPFKGVYLHRHSGLWHARIQMRGRAHSLGYFASAELAAAKRDEAARQIHGVFARTNEAA